MTDELQRAMGRIESKVDMLLDRDADRELRLSSLERSRSWLQGILAVLAVAWAAILKLWSDLK